MTSLFSMGRRYLLVGVACGLGLFAVQGREACAGPLTLTVTESGGPAIDIVDGGGLDTDGVVNGIINVNYQLLNLSLVNYQFSGLTATSSALVSENPAFLKQTGTVNLTDGGSGSISIVATDNNYESPAGLALGTLNSSATALFTQAPSGTQGFTSWYNPGNTLGATEVPSPPVALASDGSSDPNSQAGDAAPTPVTLTSPFGLTNSISITLTGSVAATDQFSGSTTLTAIPEPASLALMLTAVPVTLLGAMRRRKVTS